MYFLQGHKETERGEGEGQRVKFNIGIRFGGLVEKTPFSHPYFKGLEQEITVNHMFFFIVIKFEENIFASIFSL